MKKLLLMCLILVSGCSSNSGPQESLNPSIMSEADKTDEIQRMLDQVGVKLPGNWEDMNKQERGAFLLPVLMEVDVSK